MIFVADERLSDGVYSRHIDATDWADAENICASLGWKLLGTLEVVIDAESGATTYDREAAEAGVTALLSRIVPIERESRDE